MKYNRKSSQVLSQILLRKNLLMLHVSLFNVRGLCCWLLQTCTLCDLAIRHVSRDIVVYRNLPTGCLAFGCGNFVRVQQIWQGRVPTTMSNLMYTRVSTCGVQCSQITKFLTCSSQACKCMPIASRNVSEALTESARCFVKCACCDQVDLCSLESALSYETR